MKGILGTENLSVVYDKGTPKEFSALKSISFYAEPGEFVIVFGPSGCGKSTLLYMLSGIERHIDSGEAWVNGKDIVRMTEHDVLSIHRHDVGMIFQAYNLIGTLNVLGNVALPLLAIGSSEKSRTDRAMALLERFGVAHLAKRYPSALSGGQQQRVAVARALITNPSILFADEPTGNLDAVSTEIVLKQLLELRVKDKKTILMVTHDPTFLHYADRIIYLKDGNLVKVDTQVGTREFDPSAEHEYLSSVQKKTPDEMKQNSFGNSPYDSDRVQKFSSEEMIKVNIIPKFIQYVEKELGTFLSKRLMRVFIDSATKKLDQKDTLIILEKPIMEGGFAYGHDRASAMIIAFEELFDLREWLLKCPPKSRLESLSFIHISCYCLGTMFGHLSTIQNYRLEIELFNYLRKKINRNTFLTILQSSVEQGGLGFSESVLSECIEKADLISDLIVV